MPPIYSAAFKLNLDKPKGLELGIEFFLPPNHNYINQDDISLQFQTAGGYKAICVRCLAPRVNPRTGQYHGSWKNCRNICRICNTHNHIGEICPQGYMSIRFIKKHFLWHQEPLPQNRQYKPTAPEEKILIDLGACRQENGQLIWLVRGQSNQQLNHYSQDNYIPQIFDNYSQDRYDPQRYDNYCSQDRYDPQRYSENAEAEENHLTLQQLRFERARLIRDGKKLYRLGLQHGISLTNTRRDLAKQIGRTCPDPRYEDYLQSLERLINNLGADWTGFQYGGQQQPHRDRGPHQTYA